MWLRANSLMKGGPHTAKDASPDYAAIAVARQIHFAASQRGQCGKLNEDRYSLRCRPQFIGLVICGLALVRSQIEVEAYSGPPHCGSTCVHTDSVVITYLGSRLTRHYMTQLPLTGL